MSGESHRVYGENLLAEFSSILRPFHNLPNGYVRLPRTDPVFVNHTVRPTFEDESHGDALMTYRKEPGVDNTPDKLNVKHILSKKPLICGRFVYNVETPLIHGI